MFIPYNIGAIPMKFIKTVKTTLSPEGGSPTFYFTEDGKVVIQGYILPGDDKDQLAMPENEDAVIMPVAMLRDILDQMEK